MSASREGDFRPPFLDEIMMLGVTEADGRRALIETDFESIDQALGKGQLRQMRACLAA
jgi:hypothetical protein